MLRFVLSRAPIRRLARGIPVVTLLSAVELARLGRAHLARLDRDESRRLFQLAGKLRGGAGSLSEAEREELGRLVAKLEPRLFIGSVARQLSPVPVPKRLAYGPRGSRARVAAGKRS